MEPQSIERLIESSPVPSRGRLEQLEAFVRQGVQGLLQQGSRRRSTCGFGGAL
jgi:hypothetical protein